MPSPKLPRIEFLGQTNLSENHCHSLLISALRGLAAVQVVAAHIRAQMYPSLKLLPDPAFWYQLLAFFTGFAHQAVVLFFLLSGWLVAAACSTSWAVRASCCPTPSTGSAACGWCWCRPVC